MTRATDPVCGMSVEDAGGALAAVHAGQRYVFCSSRCKQAFKADPQRYVAPATSPQPPPAVTAPPPEARALAPDEVQQQILQYFLQSQKTLVQAEEAEGQKRAHLIAEHMRAMEEALARIGAAKPRPDMTPQEQSEWIAEHVRLMDQLMQQLIVQYSLMLQELRR